MNATGHSDQQKQTLMGLALCGCKASFITTVDHQTQNNPAAPYGTAVHSNPGAVVAQLPR